MNSKAFDWKSKTCNLGSAAPRMERSIVGAPFPQFTLAPLAPEARRGEGSGERGLITEEICK